MEARMAQVASELRRLQEAEGRLNIARSGSGADRMVQLHEQLNVMTQHRLQHLETIQSQQLELQVQSLAHFSTYSSQDI